MDEDIFGGGTPTPEPTPAPEPAADTRLDALTERLEQTNQAVATMATQLGEVFTSAAAEPAPQPVQAPVADPTTDEFLNDLATRGTAVVDERVNAGIKQVADAQLTPVLTTMIETAHTGLMAEQRMAIDSDFGVGTFDEVILPELSKEIGQLRSVNARALADGASIKALVDRHIGMNYQTLKTKETGHTTAQAEEATRVRDELIKSLPTSGGARISLREGEIDADTKTFFKELKDATGETIDTEQFDKMRSVNTLSDYLKVTAGSAE